LIIHVDALGSSVLFKKSFENDCENANTQALWRSTLGGVGTFAKVVEFVGDSALLGK
jgi:hypothetical protein